MEKVIIVIPVYKKEIDCFQRTSLKQCYCVFNQYPITLVCSRDLNVDSYLALAKDCKKELNIERFENVFFESFEGYNKLLLSTIFYNRFIGYEYMLLHQSDAYIFRDELVYWCDSGFDYIGAPWFDDINEWIKKKGLYPAFIRYYHRVFNLSTRNVGNGGLSLRNIYSCSSNLKRFKILARNWRANEDSFFSHCVAPLNPFFKIPSSEVALTFAFDSKPETALALNDNNLPFGCHAWYRTDAPHYDHNYDFWKKYIK